MDENNPIVEILRQINQLSGAALEALLKEGGGGEGGGAPKPNQAPPREGEKPAGPPPQE